MPGHDSPSTTRFWNALHPAIRWIRYPLQIAMMFLIFAAIIWIASWFDQSPNP